MQLLVHFFVLDVRLIFCRLSFGAASAAAIAGCGREPSTPLEWSLPTLPNFQKSLVCHRIGLALQGSLSCWG